MKKNKADCCPNEHPDHSKEIGRLNRVAGQVEGVKKMIQERRYCPDIIAQLRAAKSAINSVEAGILERHLDSCVSDVLNSDDEKYRVKKISELKEIYKRFGQ